MRHEKLHLIAHLQHGLVCGHFISWDPEASWLRVPLILPPMVCFLFSKVRTPANQQHLFTFPLGMGILVLDRVSC